VVIKIPQVGLAGRRHSRQGRYPGHQRRDGVALRCHQLPQADQPFLHLEQLGELLVAWLCEDLLLEVVDPVIEVGQRGEEAVDQGVQDVMQQNQPGRPPPPGGGMPSEFAALAAQAGPQLVKHRAGIPPDRDQVMLGNEAVDLDQRLARSLSPVGNEVGDIIEVVQLGALAELLDIFKRERMNLEYLAQHGQVIGGRQVQIQPEQLVFAQQALDRRTIGGNDRTVEADEVSVHPAHRAKSGSPPSARPPVRPARG
jgi:hypothetical protein